MEHGVIVCFAILNLSPALTVFSDSDKFCAFFCVWHCLKRPRFQFVLRELPCNFRFFVCVLHATALLCFVFTFVCVFRHAHKLRINRCACNRTAMILTIIFVADVPSLKKIHPSIYFAFPGMVQIWVLFFLLWYLLLIIHSYVRSFARSFVIFFVFPQELKQKEKAERNARIQVAEDQQNSIKDEIAKQVHCGLRCWVGCGRIVLGCVLFWMGVTFLNCTVLFCGVLWCLVIFSVVLWIVVKCIALQRCVVYPSVLGCLYCISVQCVVLYCAVLYRIMNRFHMRYRFIVDMPSTTGRMAVL